ncbi:MAG TPA: hypothetical protein VFC92_06590 [Bacteroidales bacterium]|jgi:phosphoribosyl-ATP pyrophosphohydrolase|nr:hypothetical protein [Bacteroidales bacterium]
MKPYDVLDDLAANLDEKIVARGIVEMLDGPVLKLALRRGYDSLHRLKPELADEAIELAKAYLDADANAMIDEAADLGAAVLKLIIFKRK